MLTALGDVSSGDPAVGVPGGRHRRGHRARAWRHDTPLNLQPLSDDGLVGPPPDGSWRLMPQGIAWPEQDCELFDR
jgi:hypothetical protein